LAQRLRRGGGAGRLVGGSRVFDERGSTGEGAKDTGGERSSKRLALASACCVEVRSALDGAVGRGQRRVLPCERAAIVDLRRRKLRAGEFNESRLGLGVGVDVQFCADWAWLCGVADGGRAFFMQGGRIELEAGGGRQARAAPRLATRNPGSSHFPSLRIGHFVCIVFLIDKLPLC
jgi:hypothetical protein